MPDDGSWMARLRVPYEMRNVSGATSGSGAPLSDHFLICLPF